MLCKRGPLRSKRVLLLQALFEQALDTHAMDLGVLFNTALTYYSTLLLYSTTVLYYSTLLHYLITGTKYYPETSARSTTWSWTSTLLHCSTYYCSTLRLHLFATLLYYRHYPAPSARRTTWHFFFLHKYRYFPAPSARCTTWSSHQRRTQEG